MGGPQDGRHLHRQLHRHPRVVQEDLRAVHRHVQAQGLPPLVHWGGYGRDGVHRGRVQHERPGERVPAVPGGHRRGRGRVRRGGGGGGLNLSNKPATTKPLSKETKPNYCNLSFPVKCVQESIKIKPDSKKKKKKNPPKKKKKKKKKK